MTEHLEKLTRLGVQAKPDEIINSALVARASPPQEMPHVRVYAIADASPIEQLAPYFQFCENPNEIDVVIARTDRAFDYRKLTIGFHALRRGARFWATNADATWPQPGGEISNAGAIIGALEGCTNRKVELVVGKPSQLVVQLALARLGCTARECLLVGDGLQSDIAMGECAGMKTARVLTGVTRREQLANNRVQPDYVLGSIAQVPRLFDGN